MTPAPSVVILDDEITLAVVMRTLILQGWPDAQVSVFTEARDLDARLHDVPAGSVVLMDRRLDGVDSYGVIAALTKSRPDLRVVMLSASLGPDDAATACAAGAVAAYEKPGGMGGWQQLLSRVFVPTASP